MPQQSKFVHIDSRSRISGDSHNYAVNISPSLSKIKSAELVSVSIPQTNYIITSSNNKIYFTDGTSYTATITEGIYDYITILPEIKTKMEATAYAGTITLTYNDNFKFEFAGSVNFGFEFGTYTTNSMNEVLGFAQSDTAIAASHVADMASNLSIPPCMLIKIRELGTHHIVTSSAKYGTFIIYSNVVSGFVTQHFANTNMIEISEYNTTQPISQFNVELIDAYTGEPLILYSDWQFTLKLTYF